MRDKFIKSRRINDAITEIQREEFSNYANIAREYKYNYRAIYKQTRSLIKSKKNINSF